ncbi:acyl carrier protein [Amycolatopsis sp. NPDC051128]|uniref:acyl carrier protein n=1 Tax=Amycolatopsis sp. NPDC051128 TaxID=3155412 RepID=UPI00343F5AE1
MTEVTAELLFEVIVGCAGESEAGPLTAGSLDVSFDELGYDSLALMEATAKLRKITGVEVEDELLAEVDTPRRLLALLNGQFAQA